MSSITFTAAPYLISSHLVLRLPKDASAKLPSRGQAMVEGTVNGQSFTTPLEPDGAGSHWFEIEPALQKEAHLSPNTTAQLVIEPVESWPEPELPADIAHALQDHPKANVVWREITPMARWEWVRWTRSTVNPETRQRRIAVACSKLEAGKRRPCCWNRNLSTVTDVSKNGILLGAFT